MDSSERSPHNLRDTFLSTLVAVQRVVASREVGARWNEPSALAAWSVRGLAGHLVRACLVVEQYLDRPAPANTEPISPAAYFAPITSDITAAANVAIRQRGEELAAAGQAHLANEMEALLERLTERLPREPEERRVQVAGGVTMRLDDYLVTRLVELTVHVGDLAVSVGRNTPILPTEAWETAISALVSIARFRHGDVAVLHALSRRERQSVDVLQVL
jgi:mycothiol maleylpyruvate isomerase-like protein